MLLAAARLSKQAEPCPCCVSEDCGTRESRGYQGWGYVDRLTCFRRLENDVPTSCRKPASKDFSQRTTANAQAHFGCATIIRPIL